LFDRNKNDETQEVILSVEGAPISAIRGLVFGPSIAAYGGEVEVVNEKGRYVIWLLNEVPT
jgi:hypothetical protein